VDDTKSAIAGTRRGLTYANSYKSWHLFNFPLPSELNEHVFINANSPPETPVQMTCILLNNWFTCSLQFYWSQYPEHVQRLHTSNL